MCISQSPERCLEPVGPNRACDVPRLVEPVAIDHRDVGADSRILRHVAVEARADLDFKVLCNDMLKQLLGLRILLIDDRDDLEKLVERDRNCRGFDVARDHPSLPCLTQSTR